MSITTSSLGFPRIGPRRELKKALERYWSRETGEQALLDDAAALRTATWARQHAAGIAHIPSNDFSLYDHVLDTSAMVGAIPDPYGWSGGPPSLDTYFAMARGTRGRAGGDLVEAGLSTSANAIAACLSGTLNPAQNTGSNRGQNTDQTPDQATAQSTGREPPVGKALGTA